MAFSWFILLLVTMVHTSTTVKKEQDDSTRDKTKEAGEDSSEYDEEEWDEFFKEVQRKIDEENREFVKGKRLMKSASTSKQYTRRKNVKRHSGPLTRARSLSGIQQIESPWTEGLDAPSASTQHPSHSKRRTTDTDVLESLRQEQKKLSAEQERMSKELQQISSQHKKIKKKYSNISKMLKGILSKLSCTSSDSSD